MIVSLNNVRCNKCGRILDDFDVNNDYSIHRKIGYGSGHDGELLELRLCSDCLDELIEACKISPVTENF